MLCWAFLIGGGTFVIFKFLDKAFDWRRSVKLLVSFGVFLAGMAVLVAVQ